MTARLVAIYARRFTHADVTVKNVAPSATFNAPADVDEGSNINVSLSDVVDPGTARISRYSARLKVQRLPIEPISQASADQRKGRCGRVAEGICIRAAAPEETVSLLRRELRLEPDDVYRLDVPLALSGLWSLVALDRPELKLEPWTPVTQPRLQGGSTKRQL